MSLQRTWQVEHSKLRVKRAPEFASSPAFQALGAKSMQDDGDRRGHGRPGSPMTSLVPWDDNIADLDAEGFATLKALGIVAVVPTCSSLLFFASVALQIRLRKLRRSHALRQWIRCTFKGLHAAKAPSQQQLMVTTSAVAAGKRNPQRSGGSFDKRALLDVVGISWHQRGKSCRV
ncbi:hypothetical protein PHYPSEUDO_003167 [Phytophthora pseudosyringae]|uniref:Uncharacterized protein n=1 Tax=Phytophthora pseudosyringae TaxID=221518 RepID=A0A8T1V1K0_9STRA|nr:hypothetical protein PHYPSEUDO_003167 [Phytophthora pseudosyringae]